MINIIAALSENRVIGCGGKIPWDIPEDRAHFRRLTTGNTVIMGRRTFEEIGRPLPERINIVVSTSADYSGENLYTARSLGHALELAKGYSDREIFLCGGERIYREGLSVADRLYLTELDARFDGDAFFPVLGGGFALASDERVEGEISYRSRVYVRLTV
jgi:dihydrofolate reductase